MSDPIDGWQKPKTFTLVLHRKSLLTHALGCSGTIYREVSHQTAKALYKAAFHSWGVGQELREAAGCCPLQEQHHVGEAMDALRVR